MKCEPCTYLQESAVDCLPTSFSDIHQLSLLSGNPTPAKSCANEPLTDGFPACQCGKGMSDCSIHPSTPEKWIASMQASLAKTLALLDARQVYLREPDQVFTEKSCASLAWLDQSSCSWRTYQQSFLTDSEPYSQTWPRWGMTQGGSAYAHPMSERRITETDGFYLPTPTVTTGAQVAWDKTPGQTGGTSLAGFVNYFPTPDTRGFVNEGSLQMLAKVCNSHEEYTAMGYRAAATKKDKYWTTPLADDTGFRSKKFNQGGTALSTQVGGQLNPNWVGWLMGFPIGWANSKATAMLKSRCKPQQPIDCLEVSE